MAQQAAPKRKDRPQLTLIPEDGRAINYRFEVVLVGQGSKDFAKMVVESEMAEAFHPKGYKPEQEGEATESAPLLSSSGSLSDRQQVLFCPLGNHFEKRGLARVRIICVEGFSDSVPQHSEPTIAVNSAVVFLFWHVGDAGGVQERLTDFTRVLAEINHQPSNCRPLSVVHAYEAGSSQEAVIREFLGRPLAQNVSLKLFDEDGEDTVLDAFTGICESLIERAAQMRSSALSPASRGWGSSNEECVRGTRCCAVS